MEPSFRIDLRRYPTGCAGHRHAHHQIVVALEGRMTIDVAGREGCVSRGVAALVPGGATHAFDARADSRFLVVDVAGIDAPAGAPPSGFDVGADPFVAVAPDVRGYLDFLGGRADARALPDALAAPAGGLVLGLLRAGDDVPVRPPPSVERACRVIDARLDRPTSVADVARLTGRSVPRLHALFRAHLGTTPGRYLEARRMDEAARLLDATALPVARIAEAVGFADASSFGRAFRRARGESPSARRRRARGDRD